MISTVNDGNEQRAPVRAVSAPARSRPPANAGSRHRPRCARSGSRDGPECSGARGPPRMRTRDRSANAWHTVDRRRQPPESRRSHGTAECHEGTGRRLGPRFDCRTGSSLRPDSVGSGSLGLGAGVRGGFCQFVDPVARQSSATTSASTRPLAASVQAPDARIWRGAGTRPNFSQRPALW